MLGNLPDSGQVQTLMCYLGVGDTFTPFHKDPCGSIGQNIMVYTESGGSSFWFMTEGSHALELAQYFQELGHVLDWETYVATIEDLKNAPFPVYIAEQTLGDMIIVPPKVGHQVVNYGGISIKVAWSRMSISSLKISLYEELPLYRRVCRAETYKVKAIIHYALRQYSALLQECTRFIKWEGRNQLTQTSHRSPRQREQVALAKTLQDLLLLYQDVIIEEQCPGKSDLPCVTEGTSPYRYDILCDYCGGDIFQSFFECFACVDMLSTSSATSEQGSGICICPSCYAEGRTCFCGEMSPVQCRPFDELLQNYNDAADVLAESGLERSSTSLRLLPHQRFIPVRQHVALFEAACLLHALRSSSSPTEVCFANKAGPSCRGCHRDTCLVRMLNTKKAHASEMLNLTNEPDWSNLSNHTRKAGERIRGRERHITHMSAMLARLAVAFPESKALHPRTKPGWYDKPRTSTIVDSRDEHLDSSELGVRHTASQSDFIQEASSYTDEPRVEVAWPVDRLHELPAKSPTKKARLDYVLVPFVKGISKVSTKRSSSTITTLYNNDLDMTVVESDDDDTPLPELVDRSGRRSDHLDWENDSVSTHTIDDAEQIERTDQRQRGWIASVHNQRDRRMATTPTENLQHNFTQVLDHSFRSNTLSRLPAWSIQSSEGQMPSAKLKREGLSNQGPREGPVQSHGLRTVSEDAPLEAVGEDSVNMTASVANQTNTPESPDNASVRDKSPVSIRIEMSSSLSRESVAVFINPQHTQGGVGTSLTYPPGIVPALVATSSTPNTFPDLSHGGPTLRSQWPRDTCYNSGFGHPRNGYGHQYNRRNGGGSRCPYDYHSSNSSQPRRGGRGKAQAHSGSRPFKPYVGFQPPRHTQHNVNEGGHGPWKDRTSWNASSQAVLHPTESRHKHSEPVHHPTKLMNSTATQTGGPWDVNSNGSISSNTQSNSGMGSSTSSILSAERRPPSRSTPQVSATPIVKETMHERPNDQPLITPRRYVSPSEREVSLECMD